MSDSIYDMVSVYSTGLYRAVPDPAPAEVGLQLDEALATFTIPPGRSPAEGTDDA